MIHLHEVSRTYLDGGRRVVALRPVSLTARDGEVLWVWGPSGAGKSTLLGIGGLLLRSDTGSVSVNGVDFTHASDAERTLARQHLIGFVPQQPRLFRELTAAQNVALAVGSPGGAPTSLSIVGMAHRAHSKARSLSGGEQQRVAITRALHNDSAALLADEPTSALDDGNAQSVLRLFRRLADDGRCVVIASHDPRVAEIADDRLAVAGPEQTGPEQTGPEK